MYEDDLLLYITNFSKSIPALYLQVNSTVRSRFFQFRQISKLKPILSKQHLETVIHAFVTSCLDYSNSSLTGISKASPLARPASLAAAGFLTGAARREHTTPVLNSLHWLPVLFRIQCKLLLFVFKPLNGLASSYLSELSGAQVSRSPPFDNPESALQISR